MLFSILICKMQNLELKKTVVDNNEFLLINKCSSTNLDGVKVELCENRNFDGPIQNTVLPINEDSSRCILFKLPQGYENHYIRVMEMGQGNRSSEPSYLPELKTITPNQIVKENTINEDFFNPLIQHESLGSSSNKNEYGQISATGGYSGRSQEEFNRDIEEYRKISQQSQPLNQSGFSNNSNSKFNKNSKDIQNLDSKDKKDKKNKKNADEEDNGIEDFVGVVFLCLIGLVFI